MNWSAEQRELVGEAVTAWREELGMTQEEAVAKAGGGVSVPVWSILENGRQSSYKSRTIKAVCRALHWTPESLQAIADGGKPTLTPDFQALMDAVSGPPIWPQLIPKVRESNWARLLEVEAKVDGLLSRLDADGSLDEARVQMSQMIVEHGQWIEDVRARLLLLEGQVSELLRQPPESGHG